MDGWPVVTGGGGVAVVTGGGGGAVVAGEPVLNSIYEKADITPFFSVPKSTTRSRMM